MTEVNLKQLQFARDSGSFYVADAFNEIDNMEWEVYVKIDLRPDGEKDYLVFKVGKDWVFSISVSCRNFLQDLCRLVKAFSQLLLMCTSIEASLFSCWKFSLTRVPSRAKMAGLSNLLCSLGGRRVRWKSISLPRGTS